MKISQFFLLGLVISMTYMTLPVSADQGIQAKNVQSLVTSDGFIHLNALRADCHLLTDDDITIHKKTDLPKKRKAFKRAIKHICDKLEMQAWTEQKVAQPELQLIYELQLIKATYLQKANSSDNLSLFDKIRMGLTSLTTPLRFNYIIPKKAQDILIQDQVFFEENLNEDKHKRFDDLAKIKKIDDKKVMFVRFDEVSGSGSGAKLRAIDIKDEENEWSVKWGDEIHSDVVGSRLFAALGFDVDHPYYSGLDQLYLILPPEATVKSSQDLIAQVKAQFNIDITRFISRDGVVGEDELSMNKHLKDYIGHKYITFLECAFEARPNRVKRIGSIVPKELNHEHRSELRASLLAHLFIDNWDTREGNTMISINNIGNRVYKTKGVFNDLGTSMGVHLKLTSGDFRVGLVNEFSWDLVERKNKKINFKGQMNSLLKPFKKATYNELKWMAQKIAGLSKKHLEKMLEKSGWPEPIQTLYLHKLAARRAQIVDAFEIVDPHPIKFDRNLSIVYQGEEVVKNGVLMKEIDSDKHAIGFLGKEGRMRNYGAKNVK